MKKIFVIGMALSLSMHVQAQKMNVLKIKNAAELRAFFKYTGKDVPFVSGHRGGINKGYPENSIEAFANTLRHTPAMFEIDPRLSKDGVPVLMHDATLERTTTGKGKVGDYTLAELKQLYLKDVDGNVTKARIPTLEEAIRWAKGKTVLSLDKKDVPFDTTLAIIKRNNAEGYVMVTVHSAKEATWYHERNKDIFFEAFVKTQKALEEYEAAKVPFTHMMAYVGPDNKPELKALYAELNKRGVMCFISTASSSDKLPDAAERKKIFQEIIKDGASFIEADLSIEAAEAIKPLLPAKSEKQQFFGKK